MNTQTLTLHITGMHCNACILLTESEAQELPYITRAKSDLKHHTIKVEGDFADKSPEEVAAALTGVLRPHGYTISVEKKVQAAKNWSDFKIAIPIALAFVVGFVLLQNAGLVNLVDGGNVTYGTAFVIGIIASLSTCMAVVGGLVLSMSATFAKEGDRVKPQLLFHAGRLLSFFILGGVIGVIGSAFALNTTATFVLSLLIAVVMLLLGINLLDVFHWSKRLQPSMPKFLARHAYGASKLNHTLTPLLVGIATFFLPCGFTQAMQIYSLGTGSFWSGAFTMGAFALGTLPVLGLISFSSFSIQNRSYSGIFFKTAGLIVILFAFYNLMNALVVIGVSSPSITNTAASSNNVSVVDGKQIVEVSVKGGYHPQTSTAKAGVPTVLRFTTSGTYDCSSSIRIPSVGISKSLPQSGTTDIDLGSPQVETLRGTCGMGMYTFEVDFQG